MDVTQKTVTPWSMLNGITAMMSDGTDIIGTLDEGLEFEMGTFTPSADVVSTAISFQKTHIGLPYYTAVVDVTNAYDSATSTAYYMSYFNWQTLFGLPVYYSTTGIYYGEMRAYYRVTSATSLTMNYVSITHADSDTTDSSSDYPRYWVSESGMRAETLANRYWRASHSYRWIAVWAPKVSTSWKLGTISFAGEEQSSTNRIYTEEYIPVNPSVNFFVRNNSNVTLRFYDSSKNILQLSSLGWKTTDFNLVEALSSYSEASSIAYVRAIARYSDDRTITDPQSLASNIVVRGTV